MEKTEHPKVFISYSHQGEEYERKMLQFANKLRNQGIDANIDLYEESPVEGWPRWMENEIKKSDFILVVNDQSYYKKIYDENELGNGINWEVNILYQHLYDQNSKNDKIIPVFLSESDKEFVLTPLKPFTFYNVSDGLDFDKLYWRLRGVKKNKKPSLGELRPLEEKEQKFMFFSSPIDIKKWDKAEWKGIVYLFPKDSNEAIMGLFFNDYKEGREIFKSWKESVIGQSFDDYTTVDFIEPPFPKDSWIYKDSDVNNGNGYFVHIGPNVDKALKRSENANLNLEQVLLATISRYRWMPEINNSINRREFMRRFKISKECWIMPMSVITGKEMSMENIIFDQNLSIRMSNVNFKQGDKLTTQDLSKTVLNNPVK